MKLLITGDWQVQTSNLGLARLALEKELHLIKKYKIDIHIDLGDGKEEYSPVAVEVTNFQLERARKISKAVSLNGGVNWSARLLGNHDRIGQHSDSRNWLPVFSDSCTCIDTPQHFVFGHDVGLFFLPFGKDIKDTKVQAAGLAKRAKEFKGKKILFFHCDIAGAKYSNVRSAVSESKLDVAGLHHNYFKRCFGGHIHKRQTLAGNVHYIGNPFPTDQGEVNQEKGFVVYDTDTDEMKFISSGLPCIYTFDYLQKNKVKKVPDGTQIKRVVLVSATDDYYSTLGSASAEIEKAYPNAIPFVLPEFTEAAQQTDETKTIDLDATEAEQIKGYLDIVNKDGDDRAALEAYLLYIMSIVSKKVRYAKGLIFESVKAKNILSFKKVEFNFRKKGVCLIRGVNKDWKGHSNGSGKTNLLSLVPIAIFGRTFKDQRFGEIVNDYTPDEKAYVVLKLKSRNGDAFVIERQFNPGRLRLTINGRDASQGMRSNGKKDTQGLIEELTGYTFDTLANAVYIDQAITQGFLLGTDKERAELLHKFQNLDRFTIAQKLVNHYIGITKNLINETEVAVENQQLLAKEIKERLAEVKQLQKSHLGKFKAEWKAACANWQVFKRQVEPTIASHKKKLKKLQEAKVVLAHKESALEDKLAVAKAALKWQINLLAKTNDALKRPTCSLCLQNISHSHAKSILVQYHKKKEQLKAEEDASRLALVKITQRLESIEKDISELQNRLAKRTDELEELESTVSITYKAYKREKASAVTVSVDNLKLKLLLVKRKEELLQALRDDYLTTHTMLNKAYKAFGRDGLPLFLNRLVCPILNAAAKYYSEIFVDKELQVLFLIDDGKLVPKIVNVHGGKKLSGQSLGEKAWAGIITAFAVRDIAQPTNMLILDEPGAGLDYSSAKQLGARLNKLVKKFETLLVVTHNPAIESALAGKNTVTVVKKNRASKIL